jgi:hypothetical protein
LTFSSLNDIIKSTHAINAKGDRLPIGYPAGFKSEQWPASSVPASTARQPTIFTLPIDAARLKAREILGQFPQAGYATVVENWRQLADGQIEFTMPHLPTAD